MNTFSKIGLTSLSLACASVASASISFNVAAGMLTDSAGDPMASGVIVLAADGNGDGFAVPSAAGGFTPGADDFVIAKWDFADGSNIPGEFYGAAVANWNPAWTVGSKLALMWFPGSLTKDDTAPGAGASFGAFTGAAEGVQSSGDAWMLPEDGTHAYSLQFFAEGTVLSSNKFASEYVAQAGLTEGQTLDALADASPSGAKASASSNTLQWTASNGAQSYTVQRRPVGESWKTVAFLPAGSNSYTDTSLVPGLTYEYRVIAENGFQSVSGSETAELFSERSLFGGVAVRATVIANEPAKHVFGGVILAPGAGAIEGQSKTLLLQGVGRDTNAPNGDPNSIHLADPVIRLFDQFVGDWAGQNDDWLSNSEAVVNQIESLSQAGNGNVLSVDPAHDAAMLLEGAAPSATLSTGYSFQISPYSAPQDPKENYTGEFIDGDAVVSIYDGDLTASGATDTVRIAKLAARGMVAADTPFGMIGGLDIRGNVPKQVLLMGWGPYLVTNATNNGGNLDPSAVIDNPFLKLRLGGTIEVIAENDDWNAPMASTDPNVVIETDVEKIRQAFTAAGFPDYASHPNDAAMLVTLQPGEYTVELVGFTPSDERDSGLGFIEIDEIEMEFQ